MRRPLTRSVWAAAVILLGGAVAWHYRIPLITKAAIRVLERAQLGPVQITVDKADLHEFHARDLSLRNGAIRVDAMTATYDPFELAVFHIRQIVLAGFKISFATGPTGLEIGGRPLGSSEGKSGSPIGAVRVDALTMPQAQLEWASPAGMIEAGVSATFALTRRDIHSTAFSADIAAPLAGARRMAHLEAQQLALEPRAVGAMRLRVAQATLMPKDLPWMAQAIDGLIDWQSDRTTAQLTVGQLLDRQQPMRVAPLRLSANATLIGPTVEFAVDATAGTKAAIALDVKGRHDRDANSGAATVTLQPVAFHRDGLQPADIFPALGHQVDDVDGTVSGEGTLRWKDANFSPNLTLQFESLGFATSLANISGLKGRIAFTRLWPPATAPRQTLTATIAAAGLPPAQLRLEGELMPKPALKMERIAIDIAGGEIATSPFIIDPSVSGLDTTVEVRDVDFAEIIKLLNINGLSGTGRLDGRIPLNLQDGKIAVSAGKLAAREPGLLRYQPEKVPAEIAGAGEQMGLALQALSDFHYERLTLDLDKSHGGEGTVFLRFSGGNPAVLKDQSFNFNIRIDSDFDRLADYALLGLSSAEELLRRARRTVP